MAISAEHRSKFAALQRQWWRFLMDDWGILPDKDSFLLTAQTLFAAFYWQMWHHYTMSTTCNVFSKYSMTENLQGILEGHYILFIYTTAISTNIQDT